MTTNIRILCHDGDKITKWNQICMWLIKYFGIPGPSPGAKYITSATEDYMDFMFKNENDAVLFALRWV